MTPQLESVSKPSKPIKASKLSWLGPGVVLGGLLPLVVMIWDAYSGLLGANPVQRATHQTGLLAMILLLASLACTPLRQTLGWTWPARVRKALGLLAFTYAFLHMLIYFVIDHGLSLSVIVEDILERPFITVGFAAVVLMIPLAITSTKGMVKKLGFVRWQGLHRLVYLAAGLAALHFIWQTKKDLREPLLYGGILGVLLLTRVVWNLRKKKGRPAAVPASRSS